MCNDEITIYFSEESEFAFTPFYYNPETFVGIAGPRENLDPMILGMAEKFNEDVKKYPQTYRPIRVKRSAFEEFHKAASKRDTTLMKKILEEKFPVLPA